ncbi:MAG: histidinol-phosphatase HisJ family protein [Candidatus Cloacimonetes bacterium]|nr:histidinol-phosphatase HisJ family protein [Candidatus Cloacimonadota bacterium]
MFKIDYHIHGKYSSDSILNYQELCKKAIANNYKYIAFTEHFDLIDSEIADYGLLPLRKYFQTIDKLREEFPELYIIRGIELGEPHRVKDFASKLFKDFKPDYIIGSLHVTRSGKNVSLTIKDNFTQSDVKEYYEENLEMVKTANFDTLGHLSIYKRGILTDTLPDEKSSQHIIDEIFKEMIKSEIAIEINYSGYKAFINQHIPNQTLLLKYKNLGGRLITIASDSHTIDHFNKYYDKTLDSLREIGFNCIYYKLNSIWHSVKI